MEHSWSSVSLSYKHEQCRQLVTDTDEYGNFMEVVRMLRELLTDDDRLVIAFIDGRTLEVVGSCMEVT